MPKAVISNWPGAGLLLITNHQLPGLVTGDCSIVVRGSWYVDRDSWYVHNGGDW